jgi:aminomethyltransferase
MTTQLKHTALFELHREHGARFGPFAGYEMPLTYAEAGAVAEHLHTRRHAALFDVSHMGIIHLRGEDPAAALESLVPAGVGTLDENRGRYTFFTSPAGGILDDVIVTRMADRLMVVANASRVEHDVAHLRSLSDIEVTLRRDLHLLALQGPEAVEVLTGLGADVAGLGFMHGRETEVAGAPAWISRSGYTGEDGFEMAVADDSVVPVAQALLADGRVRLAGLAARDSLRLEAGLPLYGADLDDTTTPVQAGLAWAIPRRRLAEGGFPGAETIAAELRSGPARRRVGLAVRHRRPVRAGYAIRAEEGGVVGSVTSGGFGPSVDAPVAMGYAAGAHAAPGTRLVCDARGTEVPLEVVDLPFVPHRYQR